MFIFGFVGNICNGVFKCGQANNIVIFLGYNINKADLIRTNYKFQYFLL